jgi:hypothetical protein
MRWVLLNDCVQEEHPAKLSLMNLPTDDVLYAALEAKYFSRDFLRLTPKFKNELENSLLHFKAYMSNCAINQRIMINMTQDLWPRALENYLYFKSSKEHPQYMN